jgi:hypothetical protein
MSAREMGQEMSVFAGQRTTLDQKNPGLHRAQLVRSSAFLSLPPLGSSALFTESHSSSWVEALRAHHLGDRRALQNIAPEIRTAAEIFYDGIESRLKKLPEKTRRRPLTKPKRTRSRRR